MDDELKEFRAWVAEQRKARTPAGVRYPTEKRTWAAEYARRRMAAGVSLRNVLSELTVSEPALRRWLGTKSAPEKLLRRLRPVTVKETETSWQARPSPRALTVITPRGFRIEGLDAASVVALVRELK
jgi:hypothetical protein